MVRASKLVAKIDSAAVQDGYDLYLHAFISTWMTLVRGAAGMNEDLREPALSLQSENLPGFSIHAQRGRGRNVGPIVNLADVRPNVIAVRVWLGARRTDRTLRVLRRIVKPRARSVSRDVADDPPLPHLQLPHRHEVAASDVLLRRLHGTLTPRDNGRSTSRSCC